MATPVCPTDRRGPLLWGPVDGAGFVDAMGPSLPPNPQPSTLNPLLPGPRAKPPVSIFRGGAAPYGSLPLNPETVWYPGWGVPGA